MNDAASLVLLTLSVFATATISGIVGMGGGVTLLAVMALLLPAPLVVPLHGVVQLVSNSTRSIVFFRHLHRRIFFYYVIPAMIGVVVGARFYVGAPLSWFRPAVGGFVLLYLLAMLRAPRLGRLPLWSFAPLGAVTGVLASLIGATGPLIAPFFLREDLVKEQIIGTKAAVQSATHLAKIPAFAAMGFAYGAYWATLTPLLIAAVAGTLTGKKLLGRIPEAVFRAVFIVVLSAISLLLIFG